MPRVCDAVGRGMASHDMEPYRLAPHHSLMSDEKRKLASRSNKLLDALRRLRDTEERKRQEPISSPPFHELAEQLNRDSRRVFDLAREQGQLGDKAERGSESIDDIDESGRAHDPKQE